MRFGIFLLLLLIPILPLSAKRPLQPLFLREGDLVGIVAPAGRLRADADTAQIRARFEEWGLGVRFGARLFDQSQSYFAGTDSMRAADFQAMIDDPAIKAIFAYRGGHGSVRLLPLVRLNALRRHPKWVVGFSDITMLHMALGRLGVESLHAPMPSTFRFRVDTVDSSAMTLRRALFGLTDTLCCAHHPLDCEGEATGVVAGGT